MKYEENVDLNECTFIKEAYKNKKWANAVAVTESSRNSYIKAKANTIIKEDDILAYYVWIPRYKYKLFNVDFVITNPIAIDIKFELSSDEKSSGSSSSICK